MSDLQGLSDQFPMRMYGFIRHEVQADAVVAGHAAYWLAGKNARRQSSARSTDAACSVLRSNGLSILSLEETPCTPIIGAGKTI